MMKIKLKGFGRRVRIRLRRFNSHSLRSCARWAKCLWEQAKGRLLRIRWKRYAAGPLRSFFLHIVIPGYPLVVFAVLMLLTSPYSWSGSIRNLEATEGHPIVVRLARGRRTAIHFWVKPEKATPGSPDKLQIDFLGNDIIVTPMGSDPGNLLVYARGARFVVLFQMAKDASYDDVVQLSAGKGRNSHPIRLNEDTYHVIQVRLKISRPGEMSIDSKLSALSKDEGRRIDLDASSELENIKKLKCGACIFVPNDLAFICRKRTERIDCSGPKGLKVSLEAESYE